MTRRALVAFLAAAALDPERLVYVPGRKLISIPKPRVGDVPMLPSLLSEAMRIGDILTFRDNPFRWRVISVFPVKIAMDPVISMRFAPDFRLRGPLHWR